MTTNETGMTSSNATTQQAGQNIVSGQRGWGALLLLCMAQFMLVLDVAIVNVALPRVQIDLSFARGDLQLVVTAYALTFGGLLLLGGRITDLVGRRGVFMIGLALFTLASLTCGLAQSPAMLVAARSLQGVASGILSTSQQLGGAIGLAILTAVANMVTASVTAPTAQTLTNGFRAAFLVASGFALVAALVVGVLVREEDCQSELERQKQEPANAPKSRSYPFLR